MPTFDELVRQMNHAQNHINEWEKEARICDMKIETLEQERNKAQEHIDYQMKTKELYLRNITERREEIDLILKQMIELRSDLVIAVIPTIVAQPKPEVVQQPVDDTQIGRPE